MFLQDENIAYYAFFHKTTNQSSESITPWKHFRPVLYFETRKYLFTMKNLKIPLLSYVLILLVVFDGMRNELDCHS